MITLEKATSSDVNAVHEMQVRAFLPHLEKYKDDATNPAAEPIEHTLKRINHPERGIYKILKDGVLVGGIGVKYLTADMLKVGPVYVDPLYQRQGIAQEAMIQLEGLFPTIGTFYLATILQEKGNICFYEKLGYVATGEMEKVNPRLDIIYFRKQNG